MRAKQWSHLGKLYYEIGKQASPLFVQQQTNKEDEYKYSKRKDLFDIDWSKKYAQHYNNRTLLMNEVVCDFDPKDVDFERVVFVMKIMRAKQFFEQQKIRYSFWSSGSKGLHAHLYLPQLFTMDKLSRERYRESLLRVLGAEIGKKSEHVTITMEYARNAKTNRYKVPFNVDNILEWQQLFLRWPNT